MILAVWRWADYLFTPTRQNVHTNLFEGGYTFSITLKIGIVNVKLCIVIVHCVTLTLIYLRCLDMGIHS